MLSSIKRIPPEMVVESVQTYVHGEHTQFDLMMLETMKNVQQSEGYDTVPHLNAYLFACRIAHAYGLSQLAMENIYASGVSSSHDRRLAAFDLNACQVLDFPDSWYKD